MAGGIVLAVAGGLAFGSFANVVVWRVPRKESLWSPGSRCPSCGAPIRWHDNIPVVSWVALRARCRQCRARIPARYPVVELVTASLFGLTVAILPGDTGHTTDLIAYLPLMWVLVVLAFIDLDHKILPNRIVLPSILAGAALLGVAAALQPGALGPGARDWLRALGSGAVSFAIFLLIALISPAGMGMGDVKLSALLGMSLGYLDPGWSRVFVGLLAGFFAGAVGGLALIVSRRGGMKSQVPFGPYLALGTVVGVLWGGDIARAWLSRA